MTLPSIGTTETDNTQFSPAARSTLLGAPSNPLTSRSQLTAAVGGRYSLALGEHEAWGMARAANRCFAGLLLSLLPFSACAQGAGTSRVPAPNAATSVVRLPATFSSFKTGRILVSIVSGDTRSPFRATRLYLALARPEDARRFAPLIAKGENLPSAAIDDRSDGMQYSIKDVFVTGKRVEPSVSRSDSSGRVWVTLKPGSFTLRCGPPTCGK
jgi:hypothetical protein